MKKLVLILLFAIGVCTPMMAQSTHFSVGNKNLIIGGKITPTLDVYVTHSLGNKIKVFFLSTTCQNWAEAYTGLIYSPVKWLTIGAGLGLETNNHPIRIGCSIFITHKKISVLLLLEDGGSGEWYRGIVNYKVSSIVGLGLMTQKNLGTGPRVQINFPDSPIQIWLSGMYNSQKKIDGFVSLKMSF